LNVRPIITCNIKQILIRKNGLKENNPSIYYTAPSPWWAGAFGC